MNKDFFTALSISIAVLVLAAVGYYIAGNRQCGRLGRVYEAQRLF